VIVSIRTKPFSYQAEDVRTVHRKFHGRALVAWAPGLGKSFGSLYYARKYQHAARTLIVCPATIKENWRREVWAHFRERAVVLEGTTPDPAVLHGRRIAIVNYDVLGRPDGEREAWSKTLMEWGPDLLIIDECFPAGALVDTDHGPLPIERIVEEKLNVGVRSYDFSSNAIVFRPVRHYIKKHRDRRLVKVHHEHGELVCTENHPVWTENDGYIEAASLTPNHHLRVVWERETAPLHDEAAEILQPTVFGILEDEAAGDSSTLPLAGSSEKGGVGKDRKVTTRRLSPHEDEESNGEPYQHREDDPNSGEERDAARLEGETRGQRSAYATTTQTQKASRPAMAAGISRPDQNASGFRLPDVLQGGHRSKEVQGCHRDRRQGAHQLQDEKEGREEETTTRISRVVSVEVLELADRQNAEGGTENHPFVYCLEVEETHNFFADGVLVHNCHYLKNPKSQRTVACREIARPTDHILALSGTPVVNRPAELFPILNMLRPDLFTHAWKFYTRYCNLHKTPFGVWDYSGSSNKEELNRLLTDAVMVRRRKEDVLKDLPPVTQTVVPVDLTRAGRKEYDEAVTDFLKWLRRKSPRKMLKALRAEGLVRLGYLKRLAAVRKVPVVRRWVEDHLASGEKLLVFGVHRKVLRTLHKQFPGAALIDGSVKGKERYREIDRFNSDPACRIMFANMIAGGVGWNCTATSTVLFAEIDWVPGLHPQAYGRCHGIGRGKKGVAVQAVYIVARGTVEEKLCDVVAGKQGNIDVILDGKGTGELQVFRELVKALKAEAKKKRGK